MNSITGDAISNVLTRVAIERLGQRGEGLAHSGTERLFIPYALPGEIVSVDRDAERTTLVGILQQSPDRIAPICPYFTTCGGCAVQAFAKAPYAAWKRDLVVEALSRANVMADVAPLIDAHGAGRRRATLHARVEADGCTRVGFMQARAHTIVPIKICPILVPDLQDSLLIARALADALALSGKPLDIVIAATPAGLDIDLRGHGPLRENARRRLVAVALAHGVARVSNHGTIVVERQKPRLAIGAAVVEPPPGAFLQATEAGESAIATRVLAGVAGAKRVADLFAGIGTFALRIAAQAEVTAIDTEGPALACLDRAARATPSLRRVATETRDLFHRPLNAEELGRFDAIVLDPPRNGAEAQMRAIAGSTLQRVVSVACDPQTFSRDAAILVAGGFTIGQVAPIDQFRYAAHLEMVATFTRQPTKKKRRLLG